MLNFRCGFIACVFLLTGELAAQAAQSGTGSFSICSADNERTLQESLKSYKATDLLSKDNVFFLLQTRWPEIASSPDAAHFFSTIQDYGAGKKGAAVPFAKNTAGLIYDLFKGNTALGGKPGYITPRPANVNNTGVLSTDLLENWAGPSVPQATINCEWTPALPKANATPTAKINATSTATLVNEISQHALLRDDAADLAQGLANRLNPHITAAPNGGASVSFSHNELTPSASTFSMQTELGLGYSLDPTTPGDQNPPPWQHGIIGFLGAQRVNNSSPTSKINNFTDLSAGGGWVVLYDAGDKPGDLNFRASTYVQGDTDDVFAASMVYFAAQASGWEVGWGCLDQSYRMFEMIPLQCSYDVDFDYAKVFYNGDFINLAQKNYVRGGGDISAKISGPQFSDTFLANEGKILEYLLTPLEKLSYTVQYTTLQDLTGDGAGISRLDTSIDYSLTGQGSSSQFTLSLTYTNGRADVTRQPERLWSIALKGAI